jgi:predicted lipid-binding transport protein (Tim44 family)
MASSRLIPAGLPPASLAGGLAQVQAIDKSFNEKQFLINAKGNFTSIVETYATGDMTSISSLLSPALLDHFQKAADARKAAGQNAQSQVLRIKDAEVTAARAEGLQAFITVKFVSDQENIVRDQSGTIIGGVQGKAEEVTDIWVFANDTAKPDTKWIVVETRG